MSKSKKDNESQMLASRAYIKNQEAGEKNFTPFILEVNSEHKDGFKWVNHYPITKEGYGQWPASDVITPLMKRTSVVSVVVKTIEAEFTHLKDDPWSQEALAGFTVQTILEMEHVTSVTVNHIAGKEVFKKIDL